MKKVLLIATLISLLLIGCTGPYNMSLIESETGQVLQTWYCEDIHRSDKIYKCINGDSIIVIEPAPGQFISIEPINEL